MTTTRRSLGREARRRYRALVDEFTLRLRAEQTQMPPDFDTLVTEVANVLSDEAGIDTAVGARDALDEFQHHRGDGVIYQPPTLAFGQVARRGDEFSPVVTLELPARHALRLVDVLRSRVAGWAPGDLSDDDLAELRRAVEAEVANRPGFGEGR